MCLCALACDREVPVEAPAPVALELSLMSKCPFAWELLHAALPILDAVGDRAELRLRFIGTRTEHGFKSLHGADELHGDRLLACAQEIGGPRRLVPFLGCMGRSFERIPEGFQACAEEARIDVDALSQCALGARGNELVSASFEEVERRGITASPTLLVEGKPYDGGRSTTFLTGAVCEAMKAAPHDSCRSAPVPVAVHAVLITDKRCESEACDASGAEAFLRYTLAGLQLEKLDWEDPRAKQLSAEANATRLPLVALDASVRRDVHAMAKMASALRPGSSSKHFFLHLGQAWDPRAATLVAAAP
jgi:hypothetical protein